MPISLHPDNEFGSESLSIENTYLLINSGALHILSCYEEYEIV